MKSNCRLQTVSSFLLAVLVLVGLDLNVWANALHVSLTISCGCKCSMQRRKTFVGRVVEWVLEARIHGKEGTEKRKKGKLWTNKWYTWMWLGSMWKNSRRLNMIIIRRTWITKQMIYWDKGNLFDYIALVTVGYLSHTTASGPCETRTTEKE